MRLILLAVFALLVSGCATGRGPGGEVVIGVDAGRLVETPSEAFRAAGDFLPAPWNYIVTGAGGLLAAGAAAGRSRKRENDAWDEARREAEAEASRREALLAAAIAGNRAGGVPPVADREGLEKPHDPRP